MLGKTARLKRILIDRIRSGKYPVGTRVPSVRRAAADFKVHANTVSRIYTELTNIGILRTIQGNGTFVIAVPDSNYGKDAIEDLFATLCQLAVQARQLGLSRHDFERLAAKAEAEGFASDRLKIWFVECSPKDADELANSLNALLERPVLPMMVNDVAHYLVTKGSGDDFFITTPFHLEEVEDAIDGLAPVINVNVVPTSDTLVRFVHISTMARISVIANNVQTLERFVQMLRAYTRREPTRAVLASSSDAPVVARDADIIVDSQSIHSQVQTWKPRGEIITVRYQIEPTSLAFLREVLRQKFLEDDEEAGDREP